MKQKFQKKSSKYLVVPIAALGLIAILTFAAVDRVSARGNSQRRNELAQAIAEQFNLEQGQVEDTIMSFHETNMETREQEMRSRLEARLGTAVQEGSLTEEQKYAILEKHEEKHDRMEALYDQDLSWDEMHEAQADIHEEMESWAAEQGIDFDVFMQAGRRMMGEGGKRFGQ
jgi:hypothetical protein